jgi:hypothetical protein
MRSWLSIVFVGVSGLALVACGGSGSDVSRGGGGSGGTVLDCSTLEPRPDDCGKDCSSSRDCEASFCDNRKCAAQCTATQGCDSNSTCNVSGHCVPNVGTGGTGGTGNVGGGTCNPPPVTASRVIPNIMFLVDRSGSMNADFGGDKRWDVAHDAIMSVINQTQSVVRYGLATYHWNDDVYSLNEPTDPMCPILGPVGSDPVDFEPVGFGLNNFSTIDGYYTANWDNLTDPNKGGNDTPTGDSIDKLVSWIATNSPPAEGPNIIVLATDGEPDTCEIPDGNQAEGRREALLAAEAAHDAGFDLLMLSVGNAVGEEHLKEMANIGIGVEPPDLGLPLPNGEPRDDPAEGAPFWVGTDTASLTQAFVDIVGANISCDVKFDKAIANRQLACDKGTITLDGAVLDCPTQWDLKDGSNDTIVLLGTACDDWKTGGATLTAEFACGTIVVE